MDKNVYFFCFWSILSLLFSPEFLVTAAVVEFKGPDIFGVVRFAQVNMELARIEANFNGLSPGFFQLYITKHCI